ncbi:hypothetical protein GCM10009864_28900 [Streptomyces lunalinharesii]|uniref:Uncharacterized protein n=1 Tax=Streptomyces lunalinharesii TaxID=333384 RepID=A0ABN3RSY6_9ACTN
MKSRETWLFEAFRPLAMDGRIGSTRPMPMKATTEAPAVAQTAIGWRRSEGPAACPPPPPRAEALGEAPGGSAKGSSWVPPPWLLLCMPGFPFLLCVRPKVVAVYTE